MIRIAVLFTVASVAFAAAAEQAAITLAGPAMGTTYRVTLARGLPGMTAGEAHREIEAVLARIDRALSTWRDDSDASRFNRAAAGEWVAVSAELVAVVETSASRTNQVKLVCTPMSQSTSPALTVAVRCGWVPMAPSTHQSGWV
jgi:thiamine biosynthesis lipoprotein ApbE